LDTTNTRTPRAARWQDIVAQYQGADVRQSLTQIATSLIPYMVLWYLMYLSLAYSYWITLALAVIASGFMLRIFIIFHDCTHGSFFRSRKLNDFVGVVAGLLSFTPYGAWRYRHALHHATTGNLDQRGWWDIDVLTVQEYLHLSAGKRLWYRLYRNPVLMFGIGATFFFLIVQRFSRKGAKPQERRSIRWTNVGIVAMLGALTALVGVEQLILIQLPIAIMASSAGLWMFYIQHQFEAAYWERDPEWDYVTASLKGSSYYRLPRLLQWFTGNIGFHHIHHLSAKIPNYRLEACYQENPLFQEVNVITLRQSFQALSAKLWDEDQKRMVGFRNLPPIKTAE
jgi:acyl-lipid omega-6 desaturase (Delta-12 desaturase)